MKKKTMILFLLGVIAFSYGNAIFNGFVFDDDQLIINNSLIKDNRNLPIIFSKGLWFGTEQERLSYYRPLVLLTFMIDFYLFGLKPYGYHLINILWHFINSYLVFSVIGKISKRSIMAAIAAIIFAVHPIHTDAVSAISGRGDLLAFLFFILSLFIFIKYVDPEQEERTAYLTR